MEGLIYSKIAAVMQEIGAIGKDSRNQQQGFMYRGVDAVMNALNPALVHNGIFVVPQVLEQAREERTTAKGGLLIYSVCKVKYTFYAEDGSSVEAIVIGEGMDSGDKATNKAMSIAFKYACFQVFCIPTEEMKDPDADSPEPTPKETKRSAGKKSVAVEPKTKTAASEAPQSTGGEKIDAIKIATINGELQRTGVGAKSMCSYYQVSAIEDFDIQMFMDAMDRLKKMPDKKKN